MAILAVAGCVADARGETWTLQQCVDYALANNLSLKQRENAVSTATIDLWAARGELFPSLSFSTGHSATWRPWSKQYVNVSNGTMTESKNELNYNGTYGLQAQWTVWNGGRNRLGVKRAELEVESGRIQLDAERLSLEEQIIQYYTQILYQREAVEVNKTLLASAQVERGRAAEMVDVGSMARADLAAMDAQVSQCRYNVADAATRLATYRLQLKQLLEITADDAFDVAPMASGAEADSAAVLSLLPTVADVYSAALAGRPEIAAREMGVKLADMDVTIAKRGYLPTLGMQAGINTSTTSGVEDGWARQMKENLSNMIGVTLSVPIFDNRQTRASVARARLTAADSRLQLDEARVNLHATIETLWLNAANAREQYRYATANARAMQQSYELTSEQFSVGLKDIVDLNTARDNLLQAEQQLLQAKYTALLNRALLRFYAGQPLDLNPTAL